MSKYSVSSWHPSWSRIPRSLHFTAPGNSAQHAAKHWTDDDCGGLWTQVLYMCSTAWDEDLYWPHRAAGVAPLCVSLVWYPAPEIQQLKFQSLSLQLSEIWSSACVPGGRGQTKLTSFAPLIWGTMNLLCLLSNNWAQWPHVFATVSSLWGKIQYLLSQKWKSQQIHY